MELDKFPFLFFLLLFFPHSFLFCLEINIQGKPDGFRHQPIYEETRKKNTTSQLNIHIQSSIISHITRSSSDSHGKKEEKKELYSPAESCARGVSAHSRDPGRSASSRGRRGSRPHRHAPLEPQLWYREAGAPPHCSGAAPRPGVGSRVSTYRCEAESTSRPGLCPVAACLCAKKGREAVSL